jgi:dihydrofolate reductase
MPLSKDAQDTHLVNSLDSAVALLSTIPIRSRLSRTYLIGGAQLYEQALRKAPQGAVLDRMLITRIHEPAYKECVVFLPEFRTPGQVKEENEAHGNADEVTPQPIIADQATSPWIRASTQDFDQFMGTPVTRGVIEEKGSKYTLQMWTRRNA